MIAKRIKEILVLLDDLFMDRKNSEKIMLFSLPILIFFLVSYIAINPICEKVAEKSKQKYNVSLDEIKIIKAFLSDKDSHTLASKTDLAEAQKIKSQIEEIKNANAKIQHELDEYGYIRLGEDNGLSFTDFVSNTANNRQIALAQMKTQIYDINKSMFRKELDMNLSCSGNFRNFVGFLSDVESAKTFTRIDSVTFYADKELNATLNIKADGI